jgi:hypothetical protein
MEWPNAAGYGLYLDSRLRRNDDIGGGLRLI